MKLKLSYGALAVALGATIFFAADGSCSAQTQEELIELLKGRPARGASAADVATSARARDLIDRLRGLARTDISAEERAEVAAIARESDLPQVDLEIYFELGSADISQSSLPTLVTLGRALSDEALKESVFLIAGHTDARGGADSNQALSERRAEAVKAFLVETFRISATALIAIGYGEEQLKLANDPNSGENRRVQVVNLAVN